MTIITGALRHLASLDGPPPVQVVSATAYPDRVIADGAVAYWRLDETYGTQARDFIGIADGAISGGVTLNQPGALADGNPAMGCDGTSGKIVTAASVTASLLCTVEAWVRQSTARQAPILSVAVEAPTMYLQSNGVLAFYDFLNSVGPVTGVIPVTPGQWHHVVYLLNGSTVQFYLDGLLDRSQPCLRTLPKTAPAEIGHDSAYGDPRGFWNGSLDDIAIYPTALTPQQIADHYALGHVVPTDGGYTPLTPPDWWCGVVGGESGGPTILVGHYHPGITTATRVHLKGRVFHVDSIVNREERDVELVLNCREVFE